MENTRTDLKYLIVLSSIFIYSCEEPKNFNEERVQKEAIKPESSSLKEAAVTVVPSPQVAVVESTIKAAASSALLENKEKRALYLIGNLNTEDMFVLLEQVIELQGLEKEEGLSSNIKESISKKIDYIYKKYRKQLATELALEVYKKQCGPAPRKSPWDNSIPVIKNFVKTLANDPDSIEFIGCSDPLLEKKNCYKTVCAFRGKNIFGGTVLNAKTFWITSEKVLSVH